MNDLFSLAGKRALVTGAGRGIGQAIAVAFAHYGADVALASRTKAELDETARMIIDYGHKVVVMPADLRSGGAELVERAAAALGGLDILVTSSGTNVRKSAFDHTEDDWDTVIDLNLKARFFLSQAAAKQMRAAEKGGAIIHIASLSTFFGIPNHIAYTIGNGGLGSMVRAEAVEWAADNIRVNAIAPGTIVTKLTEGLLADPAALATRLSKIPLNRLGTPADVAGAAVFLASDAAAYVTGQVLAVDGGWLAGGSGWRA